MTIYFAINALVPHYMFRKIEKLVRNFRDERIIKPIVLSKKGRRYYEHNFRALVSDFGSHRISFDPTDKVIGASILENGGWFLQETLKIFESIPARGHTFIDVGANIGTQTVYALKLGPFTRAVCFEPEPWNAQLLRANMAFNGISDRVTVIEAAAGAQKGSAILSKDKFNFGAHSMAHYYGSGDKIEIPVVTVEDSLRELNIRTSDLGLVWIDVEGFEGDVLRGWPSLTGTPLCIEYTPNVRLLPADTFAGWTRWGNAREATIRWRDISEFDLTQYHEQEDFIFA
ncbi:FkbM family methyltransferase [Mesorhizobium sp. VNQ89]|uniref:FkbM family methyltransferase n=1 Tax=Mesorhizobium quangtriensis TaxID=3157709 RepID=UPI0032B7A70D